MPPVVRKTRPMHERQEVPVSDLAQIVFRVRDADERARLEDRADALIPVLEAMDTDGRRWTRSAVYRRCMLDGLRALESARADAAPKSSSRSAKPSKKTKK